MIEEFEDEVTGEVTVVDLDAKNELFSSEPPAYLKEIEARIVYRIDGSIYRKGINSVRSSFYFVAKPKFCKHGGWYYAFHKDAEEAFFADKEKPASNGGWPIHHWLMEKHPYQRIDLHFEIISDIAELLEKGWVFDLSEHEFHHDECIDKPASKELYEYYYSSPKRQSRPEPRGEDEEPLLTVNHFNYWKYIEWRGDTSKPVFVSKELITQIGIGPFFDAGMRVTPVTVGVDDWPEGVVKVYYPEDSSCVWEMPDGTKVMNKPYFVDKMTFDTR